MVLLTDSYHPITEDETSEPNMIRDEEEEDIGTLEESSISFWLSKPNESLSQNDQSDDVLASSGDSIVYSPTTETNETVHTQGKGEEEDIGV